MNTPLENWLEEQKRMYRVDREIEGEQCFAVIEKLKEALEKAAFGTEFNFDEIAQEALAINPEEMK